MSKKNHYQNRNNNSQSTMYKKNIRYYSVEKVYIGDALMSTPASYTSLSSKDSLYRENRHLLKNQEFKFIIRKITRELNILLHLEDKYFFKELQNNQSLRICLESCLVAFPRRAYNRLSSQAQEVKGVDFKDESYLIYSYLMKIVLTIYLRISRASDQYSKNVVYDQWVIDIPKLLDLAAIYGQSNPKIVREIIANSYKMHSYYDTDTISFFNLLQKGKLQQLQRKQMNDIDFSPESLLAKNFGNRQEFMMAETMKYLFIIKDILFNLSNFIKYFPAQYVYELATDYKIQERLINGFSFFMYEVNNQWKLGNYKERYFKLHFQDLRQSMITYFLTEFQLLRRIIKLQEADMKEVEEAAHNTYETYCLLFKSQKQKRYHRQYNKLINNLIEQTKDYIFFLNGAKVIKSNEKTRKVIDSCQQYEKNYRSKHKLIKNEIDIDQIYNRNKLNLDRFKTIWIQPQTQLLKHFKQKQQKQKRKTWALNEQTYSFISKLKYGKIQKGFDKEYDDEPQEQEFNRIQLENEYIKVQKEDNKVNLSFSAKEWQAKKKKKYVEKGSIIQTSFAMSFLYKALPSGLDLSNLQFETDSKQQQLKHDLSLQLIKFHDTSAVEQKEMFELSNDYDIPKVNDDQQIQFEWNNESFLENSVEYVEYASGELSIGGSNGQLGSNVNLSFI